MLDVKSIRDTRQPVQKVQFPLYGKLRNSVSISIMLNNIIRGGEIKCNYARMLMHKRSENIENVSIQKLGNK